MHKDRFVSTTGKLLAPVLSMALTGQAMAVTYTWAGGSGTWFHNPSAWSPIGVPGMSDVVLFNVANDYRVYWSDATGNPTTGNVLVQAGAVTLRQYLSDESTYYTYTTGAIDITNGALKIGERLSGYSYALNLKANSAVTLYAGTFDVTAGRATAPDLDANASIIRVGEYGTLAIDDRGAFGTAPGVVSIARSGNADVQIHGGSKFTNAGNAYIGEGTGSNGVVLVDTDRASWTTGGNLYVGYNGTGVFNVARGGELSSNTAVIGQGNAVVGTITVDGVGSDGIGSTMAVSGALDLGTGATSTGNLNVTGGGVVDVGTLLGIGYRGTGSVVVDGANSVLSASSVRVGHLGSGRLNITNGGSVSSSDGNIGYLSGADGQVNVAGDEASWVVSDSLFVGKVAGSTGRLNVLNGGSVNVGNLLSIGEGSIVNISGGAFSFRELDNNGEFNFVSGRLDIGSDVTIGYSNPLSQLTMSETKALTVAGRTTIAPLNFLRLNGGEFSTGDLINHGELLFERGTLSLTNSNLVIGAGGVLGDALLLNADRTVNIARDATIATGAVLGLSNGRFSAANTFNAGQLQMEGPAAQLEGEALLNEGLVTGHGRVAARLVNNLGGEVRIQAGDTLRFSGADNTNDGSIRLLGGTAEVTDSLTNAMAGQINGYGTLIVDGGLNNEGAIALSSQSSDVFGNVNNRGSVRLSGNTVTTFYDDMLHNGSEFRVSAGSTAVFFGNYSGAGSFTGTGTVLFDGTTNGGNSPGLVAIEGDVVFGDNGTLVIEIGGLVAGDEYDRWEIGQDAILGGNLVFQFIDDFLPQTGDTFDFLSVEGDVSGDFQAILFPDIPRWDFELTTSLNGISLSAIASPVPLPPAIWMMISALVAIMAFARTKMQA